MEENSRVSSERGISLLIVLVVIGYFVWFLYITYKKTTITEQQIQLRIIADVVTRYTINENAFPANPANFNRWCLVGSEYSQGRCLGELSTSKYLQFLPENSKRTSYYYQLINDTAYIATPVDLHYTNIPPENTCYGNVGEPMLCYTIDI